MDGVCENKNIGYERKQDPSINAITFAYPAICKKHILHVLQPLEPLCMLKSASPMHRGYITDLLCKSVTFTKKRGGLSARQVLCKSRLATLSIAYYRWILFFIFLYFSYFNLA